MMLYAIKGFSEMVILLMARKCSLNVVYLSLVTLLFTDVTSNIEAVNVNGRRSIDYETTEEI
jgi:hypothetical protein